MIGAENQVRAHALQLGVRMPENGKKGLFRCPRSAGGSCFRLNAILRFVPMILLAVPVLVLPLRCACAGLRFVRMIMPAAASSRRFAASLSTGRFSVRPTSAPISIAPISPQAARSGIISGIVGNALEVDSSTMGLTIGVASMNAIAGPVGMPFFIRPLVMGMIAHSQTGKINARPARHKPGVGNVFFGMIFSIISSVTNT